MGADSDSGELTAKPSEGKTVDQQSQGKGKIFKSPKKMSARQQDEAVKVACDYLKRKARQPPAHTQATSNSHDEPGLFCLLLAEKLRKMEDFDRQCIMHEIDQLCFKNILKRSASGSSGRSQLQLASPYSSSPYSNYAYSHSPSSGSSNPSSPQSFPQSPSMWSLHSPSPTLPLNSTVAHTYNHAPYANSSPQSTLTPINHTPYANSSPQLTPINTSSLTFDDNILHQ